MSNETNKAAAVEGAIVIPVAAAVVAIKDQSASRDILGMQYYVNIEQPPMTFMMGLDDARRIRDDLTTWIDRLTKVTEAKKVGLLKVDGNTANN